MAVSLLFVLVATFFTAIGIVPLGAVLVWLVCFIVMASVWRCYLVPYVALTPEGLEVQGAFATRSVRYGAIRDARPGIYGLRIETMDQGDLIVWAVQKSKFAEWFHQDTRADVVVAEIMERVHASSS